MLIHNRGIFLNIYAVGPRKPMSIMRYFLQCSMIKKLSTCVNDNINIKNKHIGQRNNILTVTTVLSFSDKYFLNFSSCSVVVNGSDGRRDGLAILYSFGRRKRFNVH